MRQIMKKKRWATILGIVALLGLGGCLTINHLLARGSIYGSAVASEPTETSPMDAGDPGLVSAIKFIEAHNNYLAGIALDGEGFVWSWGYNAYGVLGLFDQAGGYAGGMSRLKYFVNNDIKIVKIAAGYQVNYAIDDQGVLYAWGRNIEGQVGNGTTASSVPQPVKVAGLSGKKIVDVSSTVEAASAVYAFADDGTAYAWGYANGNRIPNQYGYVRTPVEIPALSQMAIKKFDSGDTHHIMLATDGKVYTRGSGRGGKLGHGNASNQTLPKEVTFFNDKTVLDVSANNGTSMALVETTDGTTAVYEWGNRSGYLGAAGTANTPSLVTFNLGGSRYETMPQIVSVVAGRYVNYAIDEYGRVWSWGLNTYYSWGTDGPLIGKLNKRNPIAEQQPTTLGDGDTQWGSGAPKGPVFKGVSQGNVIASFNSYSRHGQWSSLGDGLHPTIYDKKYSLTTEGTNPNSHTDRYLVNRKGERVIYVLRRGADRTYSGNYYVADASYTGSWIVDNGTDTSLPRGITEVTSAPAIAPSERNWIALAVDLDSDDWWDGQSMKEMPYISNIDTYQSTTTFLDRSGNLYKTGLDGSGAVAWGWDYTKAYEGNTAGNNAVAGLYNMYTYEVMFMRGAPTANASKVDIDMTLEKKYLSENKQESGEITITLGEASHSSQLNVTIEPELVAAKYLIMPYDVTDPNMNVNPSREQFLAAYEEAEPKGYQAVDLIADHPEWTLKQALNAPPVTLTDTSIQVKENAVVWVLATTKGYSARLDTIARKVFDNFYTDTTLFQKGQELAAPNRDVYASTSEQITKIPENGEGVNQEKYGLPLDRQGRLIGDAANPPTFGFDKVKIDAKSLSSDEAFYWLWHTPQTATVTKTLDQVEYLAKEEQPDHPGNTHLFYYDENPAAYGMVHFIGVDKRTNERLAGFHLASRKLPKRMDTQQVPQDYSASNYLVSGFTVINGKVGANDLIDISEPMALVNNRAVFSLQDDQEEVTVVFIYEQLPSIGQLNIRQVILNETKAIDLPSNGFISLAEAASNDAWQLGARKWNLDVPSGKVELAIAYKLYELPLSRGYSGLLGQPIIPQYYHYLGQVTTTTDESHHEAAKTLTAIQLDYQQAEQYWVTVYIEPVTRHPNDYQWGEVINSFGRVKLSNN